MIVFPPVYRCVRRYSLIFTRVRSSTHHRSVSGTSHLSYQSNSSSIDSNALVQICTAHVERKAVATLSLARPPVNSLSLEMCQAISVALKDIESNDSVHGLVLASSNPTILSAGLDLAELHRPDPERLQYFWNSFQQLFLDLYGSRLAVVAAIEGHAPAAGCMLAMCCDYRIMAGTSDCSKKHGKIGLNETLLGIAAPPWLGQLMVKTIGHRAAEKALSRGDLYSPLEALQIGLVDKVVPKEEVMSLAIEEAERWAIIPPQARSASKTLTRQEHLDALECTREEDTEKFCSFVNCPKVQADLEAFLQAMKKKKK